MNCEKMNEYIPQLLGQSLGQEEEKDVLNHLMKCENCRYELAFWTKIADYVPKYEQEFSRDAKESLLDELTGRKNTAFELVKESFKIYFKVIKIITNI